MSTRTFDVDTGVNQAEAWVALLMSPECSAQERAAFEDWLALSPGNINAYLEAERIHALAASLGSDDLLRAAAQAARRKPAVAPVRRHGQRWLAAAAAVLVMAVAGHYVWQRPPAASVQQFATAMGEQRQVALSDGTVMHLDTGSAVSTRYDRQQRQVELLKGRAQFVVGEDPRRPFLVKAGPSTVRDIGTTFQVSRIGEQVNVGLLDGRVEVSTDVGGPRAHSALAPGEQVSVDAGGNIGPTQPLDLAAARAWPQGDLIFNQRRLDELVAEMNRYSQVQVKLADPALGALTVSGVFHAGDQEALVAALERGWSLHAQRNGKHEIVLRGSTAK